jgi:ATP-dependent exoDNAse (exonuclease V) alpha subunit
LSLAYTNPLRNKLWVAYFKVDRVFAAVKHNYALTCHKSQGSTYENCMMIDWDINMNIKMQGGKDIKLEERNRIKYVAATRAKQKLFIVK